MRYLLTSSLLFGFLFSFAQEWELLTPLKINSDVRGCSFLDEQRGFAVTLTGGDLFQTDDGGTTWQRLSSPTLSTSLTDVEYVTEDTVYVTGSNGALFRSADGGNSWIDVNPPTTWWLYRIHFINSQIGFAIGESGTIVRTADGGNTWQLIASNATARLVEFSFIDANTGYIAGWSGTILKTIDAGLTWTNLNVPFTNSFTSISFVDNLVGYACGTNIIKTIDGGVTWTQQTTVPSNGLNYIHFRTPLIGWAVGGLGNYYTTTNGGTTWNAGLLGNSDMFCGDYVSPSASYVMGRANMYKSTSNGSSWTQIKSGVPRSIMNGVWFNNDNEGYVVGSVGTQGSDSNQSCIIQTSNGGQTWQVRNQSSNGGWYGVHFPTATTGYVVGQSNLAKTINGGTTWTYTTPWTISAYCAWFSNANTGCVGGIPSIGGVCKTVNGGTNFSCNTVPLINKMQFVGSNVGYGVHSGMASTFFKTTDGGTTWTNMPGMGGSNGCLYFISEQEGWVGSIGYVWHTTDGGVNWTQQYAGGASYIVGIHFYTLLNGFIVDGSGNVFNTSDGGITWELFATNTSSAIGMISAHFTDNYCYAGATAGDVYRIELACSSFTAGNIFGDTFWCENQIENLFTEEIAGAQSYIWTLPPGWTGAEDNRFLEVIPSDQSGMVTVTVTNACGLQATSSLNVIVTPQVETPQSIDGPSLVCSGVAAEYSVPVDVNATTYHWTTPAGNVVSTLINELNIAESTAGTLFVRSSNSCGFSEYAQLNLTLSPPTEIIFELPDTLCGASTLILDMALPTGGVYSGNGVTNSVFAPADFIEQDVVITYTFTSETLCPGVATDSVYVTEGIDSPGNFNNDCEVDVSDLLILINAMGCNANCVSGDLNSDGFVGVDDLIIFMGLVTE